MSEYQIIFLLMYGLFCFGAGGYFILSMAIWTMFKK